MDDFDQQAMANTRMIEVELHSLASTRRDVRTNHHFGAFWEQARHITELFKTLKPLRREDRERLWTEFSALCEAVKKEHQGLDKESKSNASAIESELGSLASGHWAGLMRRDYGAFWKHAKQISHMFKTLKPLRREDRERLWHKFSGLCEETHSKQNDENETRRIKSKIHRDNILGEAERTTLSFLGTIDELKAAGKLLRAAGLLLSKYKHEMLGEHKQECFDRILEIRKGHDAWWEHFRGARAKQHQDFQARVRANLEKNHDQHRRATDALSRARAHADELRSQIASAWNDDFRERASEWLSEEEDRIRDIEAHILQIEGWIGENEQKLR